jgi:hypothetical protein
MAAQSLGATHTVGVGDWTFVETSMEFGSLDDSAHTHSRLGVHVAIGGGPVSFRPSIAPAVAANIHGTCWWSKEQYI